STSESAPGSAAPVSPQPPPAPDPLSSRAVPQPPSSCWLVATLVGVTYQQHAHLGGAGAPLVSSRRAQPRTGEVRYAVAAERRDQWSRVPARRAGGLRGQRVCAGEVWEEVRLLHSNQRPLAARAHRPQGARWLQPSEQPDGGVQAL